MGIDKAFTFKYAVSMKQGPACGHYIANMAERITQVVTRFASLLALLAAAVIPPAIVITATATAAESARSEQSCHPLLTSVECGAYKTSMAKAATPSDRDLLKAWYELMIADRDRLCPCPSGKGWPPLN